jgi:hypothetical protein
VVTPVVILCAKPEEEEVVVPEVDTTDKLELERDDVERDDVGGDGVESVLVVVVVAEENVMCEGARLDRVAISVI